MLKRLAERRPRLRREPWDPGQPEITFGWEHLKDCVREAAPLLAREHAEVQTDPRLPHDPDWERLLGWADAGSLDVWTARADGALIGYVSVLFMPHLYSRLVNMANVHTPYLMPEWRLGRLGTDMLKALVAALKEHEVQIVDVDLDRDSRLILALGRMGFKSVETRERKWL